MREYRDLQLRQRPRGEHSKQFSGQRTWLQILKVSSKERKSEDGRSSHTHSRDDVHILQEPSHASQ
jgi:hypothetical protein